MTHKEVQDLLVLSAAGMLDAEGERAIREHARECPECAAQMESLSALSAALSSRPAPEMPDALMGRTQFVIAAELASIAERQRSVWIAAGAAAFAWIVNLATWAFIHWQWPELPGLWAWLVLSTLTACIAAPAAAALARRRMERRLS